LVALSLASKPVLLSRMKKLKQRWGISSNTQLAVILIVFAITGSSAAWVAKPILSSIGITKDSISVWAYYPLYFILIMPVYKLLLIAYGHLFGQGPFFVAFVKKMLRSMRIMQ
jgi:hypothetical protein